jgi:hypothetical protein
MIALLLPQPLSPLPIGTTLSAATVRRGKLFEFVLNARILRVVTNPSLPTESADQVQVLARHQQEVEGRGVCLSRIASHALPQFIPMILPELIIASKVHPPPLLLPPSLPPSPLPWTDLENHDVKYLKCCECNEAATRKCLGILDDKEIEEICSKLHRAPSDLWRKILEQSNIGGDRRLAMLMDQLMESSSGDPRDPSSGALVAPTGTSGGHFISAHQLQHVRMLLERTRAECDECYCDRCYKDIHQGGKRAHHRSPFPPP